MADFEIAVSDAILCQFDESIVLYVPWYWCGRTSTRTNEERPFPGKYTLRPVLEW